MDSEISEKTLLSSKIQSSVELKSPREIDSLRVSGNLAAGMLETICRQARAGMTTDELDQIAVRWIQEKQAKPAFLNYHGFPKTICISVNEEVVHGIPGQKVIREGDIVGIDVGLFYDGWCGDTARTIAIGKISPEAQKLLEVSKKSLERAMETAVVGRRLGDVSYAMQSVAEEAGYGVVRNYGGHGIGRRLHEEPHVPCVGKPGTGIRLTTGMVLALEVMVNGGTSDVTHKPDGWTVLTKDGALSAHFEHMVAITDNGTEVLTQLSQ